MNRTLVEGESKEIVANTGAKEVETAPVGAADDELESGMNLFK